MDLIRESSFFQLTRFPKDLACPLPMDNVGVVGGIPEKTRKLSLLR